MMSLTVISPLSMPASSTRGSFSMRCSCRMWTAPSRVVSTGAVTSRSAGVIKSWMGVLMSVTKRTSRLVRMPTSRFPFSVIGTPEMWYLLMIASASPTVASGGRVMGSTIMPDSLRLTFSTSSACPSTGRLRCNTPRPPSRARAMARRASVTVSMAADNMGMLRRMPGARSTLRSTSGGSTLEWPGTSNTSSKVRASVSKRSPVTRLPPTIDRRPYSVSPRTGQRAAGQFSRRT